MSLALVVSMTLSYRSLALYFCDLLKVVRLFSIVSLKAFKRELATLEILSDKGWLRGEATFLEIAML